jgi:hypothetical protein
MTFYRILRYAIYRLSPSQFPQMRATARQRGMLRYARKRSGAQCA